MSECTFISSIIAVCMLFHVSVHVLWWECGTVGATWTSERSCFASYHSERLNNMLSVVSSIWVTRRSNNFAIHKLSKCFLPSTKCLLSCAMFPRHMTSTQQLGYHKPSSRAVVPTWEGSNMNFPNWKPFPKCPTAHEGHQAGLTWNVLVILLTLNATDWILCSCNPLWLCLFKPNLTLILFLHNILIKILMGYFSQRQSCWFTFFKKAAFLRWRKMRAP